MAFPLKVFLSIFLLSLHVYPLQSQTDSIFRGRAINLNFRIQVQLWAGETADAHTEAGIGIPPHFNLFLRRVRLGYEGSPHPKLNYYVMGAFDNLGRNANTALPGFLQKSIQSKPMLWDAIISWQFIPQHLIVSGGYFRPQVGRESMNSAFQHSGFEKLFTNFYPRMHLLGISKGRAPGINAGGIFKKEKKGFRYDVGIFHSEKRNAFLQHPPIVTGRLAFFMGEAESEKYSLQHKTQFKGKRKGMTLGINGSWQGNTEGDSTLLAQDFSGGAKHNSVLGFDVVCNYAKFCLDAELDFLIRNYSQRLISLYPSLLHATQYTNTVWHIRSSYLFSFFRGRQIEPSLSFSGFQSNTESTFFGKSREGMIDVGINAYPFYFPIKLSIHYLEFAGEGVFSSNFGERRGRLLAGGIQLSW